MWDKGAKIAFQITTNWKRDKIKDTIEKFIKYELYIEYERLIVFIIWEKENYIKDFNIQWKFTFDKENDIWDDNYLIKQIDKIKDIKKLEEIHNFLEENLTEFKFPENLIDEDIKKCIEILKRDFWSIELITNNLNRWDNFIERKNIINNISIDFFNKNIRWHIAIHNKNIFNFLLNPINEHIQKDYLEVSNFIQNYYKNNSKNIISFETVFIDVFNITNILYDDNLNKVKIMILLHNMYFNCDIWNNPNKND